MFPYIILLWFSVISFLLCFLFSAQLVRSLLEIDCKSPRWLSHHLGEQIYLNHCLYLYTSGVPPPVLVTQWPPLVMLLGKKEPQRLIQSENDMVSLSLPRSHHHPWCWYHHLLKCHGISASSGKLGRQVVFIHLFLESFLVKMERKWLFE